MAFAATMCTCVHSSMHMSGGVWTWCAYVCHGICARTCEICFLQNMDSNLEWLNAHWLKVEPKQSMFFFIMQISLLILKEETWAWESIIFFFLEMFSFSFKTIFLFKELFSSKTISFLSKKFLTKRCKLIIRHVNIFF